MSAKPGIRYHGAAATAPSGSVAVAIAHMTADGPVLDECRVYAVTGGEAGVDAWYRGMRASGIDLIDDRPTWAAAGKQRAENVRERAIRGALDRARAS